MNTDTKIGKVFWKLATSDSTGNTELIFKKS